MSQSYVLYERKSMDIEFRDRRNGGQGRLQCIPHLHRELELVLMLEGEAVAYADSVRSTLMPGDVFLSFPNQIHYYETIGPENYLLFIIKPDLIPEFTDLFHMGTPQSPVIRGIGNEPRIRQLFDFLGEACVRSQAQSGDKDYTQSLKRGHLLALFSELLPCMTISKLSIGDSGALRSIVSFCAQNFSENLSLSMLEEKLHLNKYYISHLFSERLGLRFNDYINSLRISEACRLLLNSDYSVTEVSEHVGFNTLRTFNRAFMKQLGVSPTDYRKANYAAKNLDSPSIRPHPVLTWDDCCEDG